MPTPIEEIKNRLDLVEIIKGYVRVQKAGANYKALCPFHNEKTPSLHISPAKQVWHCFGCSEGGDLLTFVEKIEGMSFPEALRMLADRAGVKLIRQNPRLLSRRERLRELNEAATIFFETQLAQTQAARNYLEKERSVDKKTILQFRLGFAPDQWHGLYRYLTRKGFKANEIEASGLAIRKAPGSYYDRFRNRVIFPVMDLQGQVIGFSGRLLPNKAQKQAPAKYINTPNTELYDKSRALFGMHLAKMALRKTKSLIIVEGNLDVVLAHQAGTTNVVAPCGTALTPEHFRIIKRYTDKLLLAFDPDQAGERAARRSVKEALKQGFTTQIIPLADGMDPADVIVRQSVKKWQAMIDKAQDFLSHIFEKLHKRYDINNPTDKRAFAKDFLTLLRAVNSPIERGHWLQKLAETLDINIRFLSEALEKTELEPDRSNYAKPYANQQNPISVNRRERLEKILTGIVIEFRDKFSRQQIKQVQKLLENKQLKKIIQAAVKNQSQESIFRNLNKADQTQAKKLALEAELAYTAEPDELKQEIQKLISTIKRQSINEKLSKLSRKIQQYEKRGERESLQKTLQIYQTALQELSKL